MVKLLYNIKTLLIWSEKIMFAENYYAPNCVWIQLEVWEELSLELVYRQGLNKNVFVAG